MTDLETRARLFAIAAHSAVGQTRKYTGEPYWVHCEEVADLVRRVSHTEEMLAAAWLHDVLEDTKVTPDTLRAEFGDEVTDLVLWLTDVSGPENGNRATRKALDRQHSAAAPAAAQTIKLSDLCSNTRSIAKHDPDFAVVYLREKDLLLDVLTLGDPVLQINARAMVRNSEQALWVKNK